MRDDAYEEGTDYGMKSEFVGGQGEADLRGAVQQEGEEGWSDKCPEVRRGLECAN